MDLNAARRYRFVMTLRRLSLRLCALMVAYALALQGLLVAFAPPSAAASATCLSAEGASAPSDQNRDPQNHGHEHGQDCVMHCLAFCAPLAWAPPLVGVVAKFTPSKFDLIILAPADVPDRPALDRPQSPRAPPLA